MKITDSKTITFPLSGESVTAEFSNTESAFKWRLRIGKHSTEWTSRYEGIIVLRSPHSNIVYGLVTDYWRGVLPVETPFMILDFPSACKLV